MKSGRAPARAGLRPSRIRKLAKFGMMAPSGPHGPTPFSKTMHTEPFKFGGELVSKDAIGV